MILIMFMSIALSILFIMLKHPMSMGMTLLFQTICISLISSFFMFNSWFSYILFLIMVGGMLVLFIYMTSIASNEKFKFNNKIFMIMLMIIVMSMFFLLQDNMFLNMINTNKESMMFNNSINLNLNKYINFPFNPILFMLIIYLFIALIAVVKISKINKGPLRQNK